MRRSPWRLPVSILLAIALATTVCAAAEKKGESRDTWQQPDRVVKDLGLKPGEVVADIGCGSGYFTFRLAKAVGADGKVYAEDISDKALKSLKDRVERDKLTNIAVVKGDATDIKIPAAACDAAILVNVLHHVPKENRLGLTKDVARALKPGGRLFIIDWQVDAKIKHDLNRRIPKDQLLALGKDAGLVLDSEFDYLEHQVFFRFTKPPAK
ncbi:MAG TPA: class I SAM-dependent methyltransferase [Phycisphaerae bacterium]|nr:class I SAM-dependent methyltransferase [Phycisphaerae bacterium]